MSIVDPTLAGRFVPRPRLLYDGDFDVQVYGRKQRYPLEVWEVCNGRIFAIITAVYVNTSLVNASERIAAAIRDRWPGLDRIIEFWPEGHYGGDPFVYSTEHGHSLPVDRSELMNLGLALPDAA